MSGVARLLALALPAVAAISLAQVRSASGQNSAPVVTNVSAAQIAGTGNVRITFNVSDAEGNEVTARVICSSNNGLTFDLLPVSISGDVNHAMAVGTGKQIIWNAAADYPGRSWTEVVARVYASDGVAFAGEMVGVNAGPFNMGYGNPGPDYAPVHQVALDDFSIDKYEVTNAEFQQFIDGGGYATQALWSAEGWAWRFGNNRIQPGYWNVSAARCGPAWPSFPVVVSWYEAQAYANFVGKRLPTEAEWEKAARGTYEWLYPWGNQLNQQQANSYGSDDPYEAGSTPVGFYDGRLHPNPPYQTINSPGPYGTYDQAGNVMEWVSDWYSSTYYGSSPGANPAGPVGPGLSEKAMRGGAWGIQAGSGVYSFTRYHTFPANEVAVIGFRCAKSGL